MKTVYIPKGETVRYETLATDRLVVKGCYLRHQGQDHQRRRHDHRRHRVRR